MQKKTLAILFTLFTALAAAYLLAERNNVGEIFRTPTPTATNTFTPTPTLTFTPTPTATISWSYLDDDGDGVLNYADQCPQKYAETDNGCPQNNGDSTCTTLDCGGTGGGGED